MINPLCVLLALSCGAAAFRTPLGLAEGAYELSYGPRGRTSYRLIATMDSLTANASSPAGAAPVAPAPAAPAAGSLTVRDAAAAAATGIPTITLSSSAATFVAEANVGMVPGPYAPGAQAPPPMQGPGVYQPGVGQQPQPGVYQPATGQPQPQQQQPAVTTRPGPAAAGQPPPVVGDPATEADVSDLVAGDAQRLGSLVPRPGNEPSRQWPKPFPAVKLQCRARADPRLAAYLPAHERRNREALRSLCQAGGQVPRRGSVMFKLGTGQTYVCNTAFHGSQGCDVDEYDYVMSLLDAYCGPGQAGNGWFPEWAKTYGRDKEGQDMCWGFEGQGR